MTLAATAAGTGTAAADTTGDSWLNVCDAGGGTVYLPPGEPRLPVDESPATPKRGRSAAGAGTQTAVFLSDELDMG